MRIIHTADWHLGERLGRIDRTADLRARVEAVAGLCEAHRADLLLIAGDLFSEQAGVEQMADALRHVHATFAGFFARGGTVVAVTGNHDHDGRIGLVRSGMALAAPAPNGSRLTPGRMYLQSGLGFATLEAAGHRAQLVLMPYPTRHRYLEAADTYLTREEEHRLLQARATGWLAGLSADPRFDPAVPTVLCGHFHVTGAEANGRYRLSEADDLSVPPGALPTAWAYVALGHIHKPQAVGGLPHVRYPGPLDRLDFGEKDDPRGVLRVDVGPAGLVGEPEWLPLDPTPLVDVDLTDPDAQLPGLADRHPAPDRAIVRVTARESVAHGRDAITRAVRAAFPRLHELRWAEPQTAAVADGPAAEYTPRADLAETVRTYLAAQLADDPDRDAVLALAEWFLTPEVPS